MYKRPDGRSLVVVHGGAAAQHYRNVLEALDSAIATKADYFEFDVRRTRDRALVVHHDEDIDGVRLDTLDVASAERAASESGYTLPRLEMLLARARGAVRLDVELKETGYEAAVLDSLRAHGFELDHFLVTSFEQAALDAVRAANPEVVTGLLVWDVTGSEALDLFDRSNTMFLGPDHAILDDETLERAKRTGVRLVPWTVNDDAAIQRLLRADAVAGIITDDASRALAIRKRLVLRG